MASKIYSTIAGTGKYIPTRKIPNSYFLQHEFYDANGDRLERSSEETIEKFQAITGIRERRYVTEDLVASDMAYFAALDAIESSQIDKETLDYIIVAHNFGDIPADNKRTDLVPSLAARVKSRLEIDNPYAVAYDVPFGCPGWLQGMIQADYFIRSGDARRALVIGSETLSRVLDPHDRDSLIYADGAGATILEGKESDEPVGIVSHSTRSDSRNHAFMLWMGQSNHPSYGRDLVLKMHGHSLYEYALRTVPPEVKRSMANAGITLNDVSKILIHQANAKMDHAIVNRLFKLFGEKEVPELIMPMTISWLGNSSVASIPTLLDLILKGKLEPHQLNAGDTAVFASVGAGMNINTMVYRFAK